jgi:hypothetical protein
MAKTKMKAHSTSLRDYPALMSLYDRESLAAEAILAAKRKPKRQPRKNLSPKATPSKGRIGATLEIRSKIAMRR